MAKPRVILADPDERYIIPLQFKFVRDYFDKIELEAITDREYFDILFSKPQKAAVLIVSDELYSQALQRHDIAHVFVMMEQCTEGGIQAPGVEKLSKYTSVKEIFNEIVGKSAGALDIVDDGTRETQIVLVTAATGGTGKTTVAMGISACLAKNYKRVLYINADRLQSFQFLLEEPAPIASQDIYRKLANPGENIYDDVKPVIRQELFSYLPPFRASLLSLGLDYSVFEKIALSAKRSGDYDFIVIDAESTFDENKTRLLDLSEKVILVTEQSAISVRATNVFLRNINGSVSDKYIFVCNKFERESANALISSNTPLKFAVNEYVEKFDARELCKCEDWSQKSGIRNLSYLVL